MNETQVKLSAPLKVTTKVDLNWGVKTPIAGKPPVTIKAGTEIEVYFSEDCHSRLFIKHGDRLLRISLETAHSKVTGINKMPGLKTFERYSYDGIAKTVTGHRTEPDGFGPDGSPSWLLVIGVI